MTEPLCTYEYETADGFKGSFLSMDNEHALDYMYINNHALSELSARKKYFIVKLTNTSTKEVLYDGK